MLIKGKFFTVLCSLLICLNLAGCSTGVSQEEYDKLKAENEELKLKLNSLNNNDDKNKTEFKVEQNSVVIEEIPFTWKDEFVTSFGSDLATANILNTKIVNSEKFGYLLIMDFKYTNYDSETRNFINDRDCAVDVFQNGIELDEPGITSEKDVFSYTESFTRIKNGGTIETQLVWVLDNIEDEIEVDFGTDSDYNPVYINYITFE